MLALIPAFKVAFGGGTFVRRRSLDSARASSMGDIVIPIVYAIAPPKHYPARRVTGYMGTVSGHIVLSHVHQLFGPPFFQGQGAERGENRDTYLAPPSTTRFEPVM